MTGDNQLSGLTLKHHISLNFKDDSNWYTGLKREFFSG